MLIYLKSSGKCFCSSVQQEKSYDCGSNKRENDFSKRLGYMRKTVKYTNY